MGKKKIVAAMLPHKNKDIKKMIMELGSSKVIVTDDYVKYTRYFNLKPEQRFIQLWHACGAFKMFGKHGTNMSPVTDAATHASWSPQECLKFRGLARHTHLMLAYLILPKGVILGKCENTLPSYINRCIVTETHFKYLRGFILLTYI